MKEIEVKEIFTILSVPEGYEITLAPTKDITIEEAEELIKSKNIKIVYETQGE